MEFKGEKKRFSPEEISSMILSKMRDTAEAFTGESRKVKRAVIIVPAYFNDSQRQVGFSTRIVLHAVIGQWTGTSMTRSARRPRPYSASTMRLGLDLWNTELRSFSCRVSRQHLHQLLVLPKQCHQLLKGYPAAPEGVTHSRPSWPDRWCHVSIG